MAIRILIADAHALVREGLKQLVRDVVPDALPVLCDDLHALGVRTVKGHVAILLSAFNAGNRREAVVRARRWLAKADSRIG